MEQDINQIAASFAVRQGENPFADQLLCTALDVAEHILKCGGDVHRAEDTVERICRAYGVWHVEVFCITSLLLASVRMPDGSYSSQLRRVYASGNDLYRLERFNAISRWICREKPAFDQAQARIKEAKATNPYPVWLIYLGAAMATFSFALFFGGNLLDAVSAALAGLVVTVVDRYRGMEINAMAKTILGSFFAGVLSHVPALLGLNTHADKIMIGTIMLLVPGLAFGNALRDLLHGDILAGTMRIIQVALMALMIALGYVAAIFLMGGV